MKLKKTNERWNRSFDAEGEEAGNRLESAQFTITDSDGNQTGHVNVGQGNANMVFDGLDISINGFGTVENGIVRIKELFSFTD